MSELTYNQEMRIQTLKEVILHLHRGEAPEDVRGQLTNLIAEVYASEIAAMEQQLMADGLSHRRQIEIRPESSLANRPVITGRYPLDSARNPNSAPHGESD